MSDTELGDDVKRKVSMCLITHESMTGEQLNGLQTHVGEMCSNRGVSSTSLSFTQAHK